MSTLGGLSTYGVTYFLLTENIIVYSIIDKNTSRVTKCITVWLLLFIAVNNENHKLDFYQLDYTYGVGGGGLPMIYQLENYRLKHYL